MPKILMRIKKFKPYNLSELIKMIEEGKVSNSNASSKIIPLMISSKESPKDIAIKYSLIIEDNKDEIKNLLMIHLKNILKK